MKKILIYTMTMVKGGAEKTIANLSNNLIDTYDVTIVTNIKCKCEYQLNKKIKLLNIDDVDKSKEKNIKKIFTKLSQKRSKKLKEIVKLEKPDLIIAFLPEAAIRALALKTDIPVIISIRNHPTSEFKLTKFIRDHYYKKATSIIVQDDSYKKYLNKNVQDKLITIPNFLTNEYIKNIRKLKKEKRIIAASRLEKQKNLSLLIKAFSLLDKRFDEYTLLICGGGSLKEKLEKEVKKLGLENRVSLIGRVDNPQENILKSTLFVLPSNYEGMPNALMEAMACGMPVITTRSTEVIDSLVKDNENGIIIPINDLHILKEKIEYLLDSEDLRKKIGNNASKIKDIYSEDAIMKKWTKVIKKYI